MHLNANETRIFHMLSLCKSVFSPDELQKLRRRLEDRSTPVLICGLSPLHRALVAAAIQAEFFRPVAVITADESAASSFAADAAALSGIEYAVLPARELMFHEIEGASREWEHRRVSVLDALKTGCCTAVCGSVEAFSLHTIAPDTFADAVLELSVGMETDVTALSDTLLRLGYCRSETVEGAGQFAFRGGIFDIFPPSLRRPVRIEFFGDEIDSMGAFDIATQRRTENLRHVRITPALELPPDLAQDGREAFARRVAGLLKGLNRQKLAKELLEHIDTDSGRIRDGLRFAAIDRYLPVYQETPFTALDFCSNETVFFLDDAQRVCEEIRSLTRRTAQDVKHLMESGIISGRQKSYYLDADGMFSFLSAHNLIMLDNFLSQRSELPPREIITLISKQLPSLSQSFDALFQDIDFYRRQGFAVLVLAASRERVDYLISLLAEKNVAATIDPNVSMPFTPGGVTVGIGSLSAGIELPDASVAVLNDTRPTAPEKKRTRRTAAVEKGSRERLKSFTDLHEGDLIVHDNYGIGRFCGITELEADGIKKDFIKLSYAGSDVLYIPVTQLDVISKYLGAAEDSAVKLSKLGGTDWARTRQRAKSAAKDLAKQLIALYAKRARLPGHAFAPDSAWQREFEDSFEYEETNDQLISIAEIKKDMERSMPMDRLLCGDVGFGKTEVAFRAAMKCILDSKQVAVLVPTTVLARQHYLTAMHRFRGYPVKIASLSRFSTPGDVAKTIRGLRTGSIDMVIGTHRLLNKSVVFHDLGLIIVDEEQRFGVAHKERLKEMTGNVDVLTLSATPIPRTLNMALSGVRDMSVLEESPHDRYPVTTYVMEYDAAVIRDAIARELTRGGQVYYLHNRVDTIDKTAARLQAMFPERTVIVGHGKMNEKQLGEVMQTFTDGEADILVCTTIIEAGIDIPNVNTLIIEDADRFGLAQLHQIRGRVGRSSRHAYAYLTFPAGRVLSEISQKRLAAIRDFAEFGAGFKIAMRDLEIRGAGNLLGAEQSGHMISVGYDMYLRLLEEAVLEEKGEKVEPKRECIIELAVPAGIPDTYVTSSFERMDLYRRIARIQTPEDADDMRDELCDRFGDVPAETETLIRISVLRTDAAAAGICEIADKEDTLRFFFSDFTFERIQPLFDHLTLKGRVLLNAGDRPHIAIKLRRKDDRMALSEELVKTLTPPKKTN